MSFAALYPSYGALRFGLFEIVAKNKQKLPEKNIQLCNANYDKTLMALQVSNLMGPGVQIGEDEQKSSIYWPMISKSDGELLDFKDPLSISPEIQKL